MGCRLLLPFAAIRRLPRASVSSGAVAIRPPIESVTFHAGKGQYRTRARRFAEPPVRLVRPLDLSARRLSPPGVAVERRELVAQIAEIKESIDPAQQVPRST